MAWFMSIPERDIFPKSIAGVSSPISTDTPSHWGVCCNPYRQSPLFLMLKSYLPDWAGFVASSKHFPDCGFWNFPLDLNKAPACADGSKSGRPSFDPVRMFKTLVIQTLNNLSDTWTDTASRFKDNGTHLRKYDFVSKTYRKSRVSMRVPQDIPPSLHTADQHVGIATQ